MITEDGKVIEQDADDVDKIITSQKQKPRLIRKRGVGPRPPKAPGMGQQSQIPQPVPRRRLGDVTGEFGESGGGDAMDVSEGEDEGET